MCMYIVYTWSFFTKTGDHITNYYMTNCDPFYQNETLLCKTPNGHVAKDTCGGDFLQFCDFCKIMIVYVF